ncbi:uncharacterized protein LOC121388848 [Gigantopelta aegis]|uniref:uncharacterized protein LOC121388848 n=1 Tax=Gigantopelta aegis TaxID=1735272 RepID=UPI001B88A56E|nr:uncharacterized protein LOC121388848 [Gigantopelta aegis]
MSTAVWLCILIACLTWKEASNLKSEYNLCEVNRGHYPNGDHFPAIGDVATVFTNWSNTSDNGFYHCFMKFTTCNNCHFRVEAVNDFAFPRCYWRDIFNHYNDRCAPGCTYLHMFDPDYKNETGRSYSQTPWAQKFQTESSKLYIIVCSNHSTVKDVKLKVRLRVMEKKMNIRGSAYDSLTQRYIHSPFFPQFYTENEEIYIYEWTAMNNDEFIHLTFDDWLMSPQSVIWFEYANVKGAIYGSSARPVVYSDGNRLRMRFRTGSTLSSDNRQYMGFKATYKFFNQEINRQKIITGCGKYDLSREGGTIKFEPTANPNDYYDCVWVVKRQPQYDHIYVKLISFKGSLVYYHGQTDKLEIRESFTSLGSIEAAVTPGNADEIKTYSFDASDAFYIRLQGRYSNSEDFILAFTSFKYGICMNNQYQCLNNKCIPYILKCDGYDHCGDNSDETSKACGRNPYSDVTSYTISIGVIIPMVVSIFLIVVICLLIIFIRRCRRLALQNRQAANGQINSISGNTERRSRHRNRNRIQMNLTIQQDSPPAYDDVIRNTPIGYLNMAFMWSQPDDAMISPPSYEEATNATTTDLPRLNTTEHAHDASLSSSSSVESGHPRPRILPPSSDSSTDDSQTSHTRAGSYSDSDSTINEQNSYHVTNGTVVVGGVESSHGQHQPESQGHKPVDDSFIVPVSSAALGNKPENQSTSESQLVVESQLTSSPAEPENGAASSPLMSRGSGGHVNGTELKDTSERTRMKDQTTVGGRNDGGSDRQSSAVNEHCVASPSCTNHTDSSRSVIGESSPSGRGYADSSRSDNGRSSPSYTNHNDSSRSNLSRSTNCSDSTDSSRTAVGPSSPSRTDGADSSRSVIRRTSPSRTNRVDSPRSVTRPKSFSELDHPAVDSSRSSVSPSLTNHVDSSQLAEGGNRTKRPCRLIVLVYLSVLVDRLQMQTVKHSCARHRVQVVRWEFHLTRSR